MDQDELIVTVLVLAMFAWGVILLGSVRRSLRTGEANFKGPVRRDTEPGRFRSVMTIYTAAATIILLASGDLLLLRSFNKSVTAVLLGLN